MKFNKNIISHVLLVTFLLSALIYNLLYINNKKNEIIQEVTFNEDESFEEKNEKELIEKNIYVHIDGEVITPGLYELKEGDRVNDAIISAGGITEKADLIDVNLAYVLSDGMKIIIPKKSEKVKKSIISKSINISETKNDGLININIATKEQLKTLEGIGEATAEKIIKYRENNGNFSKKEEIKNVSGIGNSKYNNIAEKITV